MVQVSRVKENGIRIGDSRTQPQRIEPSKNTFFETLTPPETAEYPPHHRNSSYPSHHRDSPTHHRNSSNQVAGLGLVHEAERGGSGGPAGRTDASDTTSVNTTRPICTNDFLNKYFPPSPLRTWLCGKSRRHRRVNINTFSIKPCGNMPALLCRPPPRY